MITKRKDLSEREILEAISYRHGMLVTEIRLFASGDTYAVCPRCKLTMEREYANFCSVCGQKLEWKYFSKARIVK